MSRTFSSIRNVLKFCVDPFFDEFSFENHDDYLEVILTELPEIKQESQKTKSTFLDVFESEYTNDEILESLRHVLSWFLIMMQDIRKRFLKDNPELADRLFKLFDNNKTPHQNSVMKMSRTCEVNHNELLLANGQYLTALLKQKSPILNEMLLLSSNMICGQYDLGLRLSTWEIRRELRKFFHVKSQERYFSNNRSKEALLARYHSGITGKIHNVPTQSVFPIGCMFTSSIAERRAIAFLIASDRCQASGFDFLTPGNILLDNFIADTPDKIQIQFPKKRAKRTFQTPIYTRDEDLLFDVYYDFYKLRKSESNYYKNIERPGYFMPSKWNKLSFRIQCVGSSSGLPLTLLGMVGTEMHRRCLQEVKKARPFLNILEQSISASRVYSKQRGLLRRGKLNEISTYPNNITMDMIAQTRAIMESAVDDDNSVTANLSAHNLFTHKNTYLDRSDLSLKPESTQSNFGAKVGDKMYELSTKMAELSKNSNDYSASQFMKALSLKPELSFCEDLLGTNQFNDFLKIIRKTGLAKGLDDQLSHLSDTYIVQDPTVAAIVISFFNHLENLKITSGIEPDKIKVINCHQIYLKTILDFFHVKYIKKGTEIANSIKLPYGKEIFGE